MSTEAHERPRPNEIGAKPRVGVPWRTLAEQRVNKRNRYDEYLTAIRDAGGEPVEVSLVLSTPYLEERAQGLDAIVLPGSPADVDPDLYHVARHPRTANRDRQRERTDFALLDHAFAASKPVLAICYGVQSLNVYRGGTLLQDIPSGLDTSIKHSRPPGGPDQHHPLRLEPGSKLSSLAGQAGVGTSAEVNSSHHQAILAPGRGLRVTAHAPDGVVEAVEWTGEGNWVVGVQWHPERMFGDAFAQALFQELIAAARAAAVRG